MDGLSIRNADNLLNTGKTISQQKNNDINSKSGLNSNNSGLSFADTLKSAVNQVNQIQKDSDVAMQKLATGESKNIPEVMIAAEKADIALKLMVQVRNKIIDAYHEVMKMQV